jgi:hypothetical protein
MTQLLCILYAIALYAYIRKVRRMERHAHEWLLYNTTTDRAQNGTVVISWFICADCKTERATCARLSMTDLTPVRLPRPE